MKYIVLFKNGVKETFNYCKVQPYSLWNDKEIVFEKDFSTIRVKSDEVVYVDEMRQEDETHTNFIGNEVYINDKKFIVKAPYSAKV